MDATPMPAVGTPSAKHEQPPHQPEPTKLSRKSEEGVAIDWKGLTFPPVVGREGRANGSSTTWTSSNCDMGNITDLDEADNRPEYIQEYNRIAAKYGIRLFDAEAANAPNSSLQPGQSPGQNRRSWFSRTFMRQPSGMSMGHNGDVKFNQKPKIKHSHSDLAVHLVNNVNKDSLKDEYLQSLVRLCGKSVLHLPSEYAPGSLVLPTCFRATAHYLLQYGAETRGVFRIPGSVRIVNALYQFYCADRDSDKIASSTCFPNLPSHIQASAHDVASTFKRLLSGLPGGILGSLSLFDAFVAIYSYLKGEPESTATRVTKLRARLIALAIGTVRSHLRRDLICAVFGLLCLIGRVAENTPREDEHGRPLPTTDLMGYSALGIVFGPLLVGDLLSSYTIKNEDPITGPVLEAVTPQPSKEKRWCKSYDNTQKSAPSVDKVLLANNITEMLITHWREVVRHMKGLEISRMSTEKGGHGASREQPWRRYAIRPSITESFMRGALDHTPSRTLAYTFDNDSSPPGTPTPKPSQGMGSLSEMPSSKNIEHSLTLPRQRPKGARPLPASCTNGRLTIHCLSPPTEEPSGMLESPAAPKPSEHLDPFITEKPDSSSSAVTPVLGGPSSPTTDATNNAVPDVFQAVDALNPLQPTEELSGEFNCQLVPQPPDPAIITCPADNKPELRINAPDDIATLKQDLSGQSNRSEPEGIRPLSPHKAFAETGSPSTLATTMSYDTVQTKESSFSSSARLLKSKLYKAKRLSNIIHTGHGEEEKTETPGEKTPKRTTKTVVRGLVRLSAPAQTENKVLQDEKSRLEVFNRGREKIAAWKSRRLSWNPVGIESSSPSGDANGCHRQSILVSGGADDQIGISANSFNQETKNIENTPPMRGQQSDRVMPAAPRPRPLSQLFGHREQLRYARELFGRSTASTTLDGSRFLAKHHSTETIPDRDMNKVPCGQSINASSGSSTSMASPAPVTSRSRQIRATGSAVRAMAAMFERSSKESTPSAPKDKPKTNHMREGSKNSTVVSEYTINPPPQKSPSKASGRSSLEASSPSRARLIFSAAQSRRIVESPTRRSKVLGMRGGRMDDTTQPRVLNGSLRNERSAVSPMPSGSIIRGSLQSPPRSNPDEASMIPTPLSPQLSPGIRASSPEFDRGHQLEGLAQATYESSAAPITTPVSNANSVSNIDSSSSHYPTARDRLNAIFPPLNLTLPSTQTPLPALEDMEDKIQKMEREMAHIRAELSRMEQSCWMWRDRAQRAELKVRELEAKVEADFAAIEAVLAEPLPPPPWKRASDNGAASPSGSLNDASIVAVAGSDAESGDTVGIIATGLGSSAGQPKDEDEKTGVKGPKVSAFEEHDD